MPFTTNADGTVTDVRTGQTFCTESEARLLGFGLDASPVVVPQAGIIIATGASSPGGLDTRLRDAQGNLTTNQEGSQDWMGSTQVSTNEYSLKDPDLAEKSAKSDAQYAQNSLIGYINSGFSASYYVRPPIKSATDNQQIGSTGGTATAAQAIPQDATAPTQLSTAADQSVNTGSTTGVSWVDTVKQFSIYILAGVIIVVIAAIVMSKAHIAGSAS